MKKDNWKEARQKRTRQVSSGVSPVKLDITKSLLVHLWGVTATTLSNSGREGSQRINGSKTHPAWVNVTWEVQALQSSPMTLLADSNAVGSVKNQTC